MLNRVYVAEAFFKNFNLKYYVQMLYLGMLNDIRILQVKLFLEEKIFVLDLYLSFSDHL